MSLPQEIPRAAKASPGVSPIGSPSNRFLIPSPVPTRRVRTYSQSERAAAGPSHRGIIKSFCREKGHGFVNPSEGGEPLFMHISDIDGDFVPKQGDVVSYKKCPVPPKMDKFSAVHVQIVTPVQGVTHEQWEAPVQHGSPRS